MAKKQKNQHIRVDEDYHRTLKAEASALGIEMIELVHKKLDSDSKFKSNRLANRKHMIEKEGISFDRSRVQEKPA